MRGERLKLMIFILGITSEQNKFQRKLPGLQFFNNKLLDYTCDGPGENLWRKLIKKKRKPLVERGERT